MHHGIVDTSLSVEISYTYSIAASVGKISREKLKNGNYEETCGLIISNYPNFDEKIMRIFVFYPNFLSKVWGV